MNWPVDAPPWLKAAVQEMDDEAERAILSDDPARACGFSTAVIKFKAAIESAAESLEQKRLKDLHALTWPEQKESN